MKINYIENGELDAEKIVSIFSSVGWKRDINTICKAFKGSYYILAYNGEDLVGFARAISDDYCYTGIYDVIVVPELQGKGIGKQLVTLLMEKFKHTTIYLTYTEEKDTFYEKFGFQKINNAMRMLKN
ncbi:MAG TPA: GNAT family N-acetyltransferase [Clostridia bacterium]|nr:GNAT family N-acetyltransferase [Clostridia bacterium]